MGGQAVVEGVMMRGERTWAVAVRTPEGDIEIETHDDAHLGGEVVEDPARARRHGAGRVDGARHEGAHVVGQPPDPRGGADLLQGDGLDDRRRARVLHRDLHRAARASRPTASATSSALDGFWFHVAEGALRLGDLPRLPAAHRPAEGHQARLPVPRRRAQGDRRLRERRRAHRRVGAAVRHRSTCAAAPTSCSR